MSLEIQITTARSGDRTLLAGPDRTALHSVYDPVREAVRMADSVPEGVDRVIVLGAGLLYLPRALSKRGIKVVILEPIEELREIVSRELAESPDENIQLIAPGDKPEGSAFPVILPGYNRLVEREFPNLFPIVNSITQQRESWFRFRERITENVTNNFGMLREGRSVRELFGRLEGVVPVVVLGAGPSLDRVLPAIGRYRKNFIILATGTALKPSLLREIVPDIVCLTDPGETVLDQIKGVDIDVPLVTAPGVYTPVVTEWRGKVFWGFVEGDRLTDENRETAAAKGTLESFGSVIHFTLSLGVKMSPGPVFLAGVDLEEGFTTHGRGSFHLENMLRDWDRFRGVLPVRDAGKKYLAFKTGIERILSRTGHPVYRIEPTSVSIEGTVPLDRDSFIRMQRAFRSVERFKERIRD